MDNLIISKSNLKVFVDGLIKKMNFYGPVAKDNTFSFKQVLSFDDMVLDYQSTILPPKKIFFPHKETLFKFDLKNTKSIEPSFDVKEQCLFGVHPCDIHGITLMDKVFTSDDIDPYYIAKREKTIIIGIDCIPDEECFCSSVNTNIAQTGFDLFLTKGRDNFIVNVSSKKGEELVKDINFTKVAGPKEMEQVKEWRKLKKNNISKRINADYRTLPLYYSGAFNFNVWGKQAEKCFGCGSCIMVCPTCYCFNVEDQVDLDLKKGKRQRLWDGCMMSEFANIATGENFRKTLSARLKHRFNRKFQFHMSKYGSLFCVGCGRCSRACLAEIKPVEVTNEIIKEKSDKSKTLHSKTGRTS